MRKVSRRPTWAMFAISGLAVWLIDNWPPHKSICFLLIFIPAGDTSTVPSFPWTKGAKQKECDAGPWEPHFPILEGQEKSQDWGCGMQEQKGSWAQE